MEFIIIDSSVLITSCLFWSYEKDGKSYFLRQRKFSECDALFEFVKKHAENIACVITKTIEIEATDALKRTVEGFIQTKVMEIPDIRKRYDYETLKNIILDQSLDKLEDTIEEYSVRLPITREIVEKIINEELEKFFMETMPETVRYFLLPDALKKLKGTTDGKLEILKEMYTPLSWERKILYLRGEPLNKDKRIMAEATYICRVNNSGKQVYIASLDYHFIPNPIQFESFRSPLCTKDYSHDDSRMRDLLSEKFGFFGCRPKELLSIFHDKGFS